MHTSFAQPPSWTKWLAPLGFYCQGTFSQENMFLVACARLAVSCIPIYVSRVFNEGRNEALYLSYHADTQISERYP